MDQKRRYQTHAFNLNHFNRSQIDRPEHVRNSRCRTISTYNTINHIFNATGFPTPYTNILHNLDIRERTCLPIVVYVVLARPCIDFAVNVLICWCPSGHFRPPAVLPKYFTPQTTTTTTHQHPCPTAAANHYPATAAPIRSAPPPPPTPKSLNFNHPPSTWCVRSLPPKSINFKADKNPHE